VGGRRYQFVVHADSGADVTTAEVVLLSAAIVALSHVYTRTERSWPPFLASVTTKVAFSVNDGALMPPQVMVLVNRRPVGGNVTVSPRTGRAFTTNFTLACLKW
jgi:hypothetical protein